MALRKFFTWLHRWTGLIMAIPLIIVALTGSLMAFHDEIDAWLNPDLMTVPVRNAPLLSGVELRAKAAALYPDLPVMNVPLDIRPGRTVQFGLVRDPNNYMASEFEFFLDPYTGERVGERPIYSGPSLSRRNIISYLFRVHFDLALPMSTGELGNHILGVTAIVWTLDCFVGLYLTFPRFRRVSNLAANGAANWLQRWMPAWLIKFRASSFRVNFDIHRAFGLWTWVILLIFAWSSVGLNENQIFTPVMHALLPYAQPAPGLPQRPKPLDHPHLDWEAAYTTGHALLAAQARAHGFVVDKELYLGYDPGMGVYTLSAKSTNEGEKVAQTWVAFDGDTGALAQAVWPGSLPQKAGDVMTNWLFWLHTTAVLGRPWQIVVCLIGLVITALAITGIYIWWRKRKVRKASRSKLPAVVALALLGFATIPGHTQSSPPPLTHQQEALIRKIEGRLMAPCCYTQTIRDHDSQVAMEMRNEVTTFVASGKSEQEIITYYRTKYGETILVEPDGMEGHFVTILPLAVFLVSTGLLLTFIRKSTQSRGKHTDPVALVGDADERADPRRRIREELGDF